MMKSSVTPRDVIDLLNDALVLDREAITKLFETRIPCNAELADHPTVQVQVRKKGSGCEVGILGLLNGMFGTFDDEDRKGAGCLAMVVESDGTIHRFELNGAL